MRRFSWAPKSCWMRWCAHDAAHWLPLYVRWEAGLLEDLGFGLDLSECAATGAKNDLIYVSPKTGRAVSRDGAGIYADRLFRLPRFLLDSGADAPERREIAAGLAFDRAFPAGAGAAAARQGDAARPAAIGYDCCQRIK